jgi:hypothetical protein
VDPSPVNSDGWGKIGVTPTRDLQSYHNGSGNTIGRYEDVKNQIAKPYINYYGYRYNYMLVRWDLVAAPNH